MTCELCIPSAEAPVWQDADWRVIRVADAAFPAFYRVIAQRHVAEFSELTEAQRNRCMALVAAVERVLIDELKPTKVNLAALGNLVPHLHWHVIARFEGDSHFPQPIWGLKQREALLPPLPLGLPALDAAVRRALLEQVGTLLQPLST